ncbi:MAG: sulfatase-like hydrolase/transferase [Limisphaerales bacterium]
MPRSISFVSPSGWASAFMVSSSWLKTSPNPQRGRIATPNLDRLASQGMTFTEAHSSSAVCTPSRYSILTGRYNWRSRLQSGVLEGYSPPLIAPGRLTVAELLKQAGYRTACFGKWHGKGTAARGRRFAFHQRLVRDSPRQLETRTLPRFRRLE